MPRPDQQPRPVLEFFQEPSEPRGVPSGSSRLLWFCRLPARGRICWAGHVRRQRRPMAGLSVATALSSDFSKQTGRLGLFEGI